MGYVTNWILKVNSENDFIIKKRTVTKHMPVNRMVEEVGHYQYDFLNIDDAVYMYVFYPEEINTRKSAVMLRKFTKVEGSLQMTDMSDINLKNIHIFYDKFFKPKALN